MLRSMYAGVSGLRNHQMMMDVVGNNISNVNTTGFKASRATFQEALNQVARGAVAPLAAGDAGGLNPLQIGLGSEMGATDQIFTQGATQLTGRGTDLAIDGDGFFVVELGGEQRFTRAGAFSWDADGRLVGPSGAQVIDNDTGDAMQIDVGAYDEISIGQDGAIMGRAGGGEPVRLGQVQTATFVNPGALTREGDSLYAVSANSGAPNIGGPGEEGRGTVQSGTLEMSNVDLAQEFTNLIMSQRGFQANSRTITTSDELLQELVNMKR